MKSEKSELWRVRSTALVPVSQFGDHALLLQEGELVLLIEKNLFSSSHNSQHDWLRVDRVMLSRGIFKIWDWRRACEKIE